MSTLPLHNGRRVLEAKPATPSIDDLLKLVAALQEQNAQLAKAKTRSVSFKVSEKGCVTMLGTGQYGTTMYASQWATVLDHAPALAAFIKANADALSFKAPTDKAATLASCQTYLD